VDACHSGPLSTRVALDRQVKKKRASARRAALRVSSASSNEGSGVEDAGEGAEPVGELSTIDRLSRPNPKRVRSKPEPEASPARRARKPSERRPAVRPPPFAEPRRPHAVQDLTRPAPTQGGG
jgi:hypothetical protein